VTRGSQRKVQSDRSCSREASIVIMEFELVLPMMNGSIFMDHALDAWERAAEQTCAPGPSLAHDLGQIWSGPDSLIWNPRAVAQPLP
jgi:hypothetical protein